jgi:hypothetical protein
MSTRNLSIITTYGLVVTDKRFGEKYYLHLQGFKSQISPIYIQIAFEYPCRVIINFFELIFYYLYFLVCCSILNLIKPVTGFDAVVKHFKG